MCGLLLTGDELSDEEIAQLRDRCLREDEEDEEESHGDSMED